MAEAAARRRVHVRPAILAGTSTPAAGAPIESADGGAPSVTFRRRGPTAAAAIDAANAAAATWVGDEDARARALLRAAQAQVEQDKVQSRSLRSLAFGVPALNQRGDELSRGMDRLRAAADAADAEAAALEAELRTLAAGPNGAVLREAERERRDRLRDAQAVDPVLRAAVTDRAATAKEYFAEIGAGKTDEHREVVLVRRRLKAAEDAVAAREREIAADVERELVPFVEATTRRETDRLNRALAAASRTRKAARDRLANAEGERRRVAADLAGARDAAARADALDAKIEVAEQALPRPGGGGLDVRVAEVHRPATAADPIRTTDPVAAMGRGATGPALGAVVGVCGVAGFGLLTALRRRRAAIASPGDAASPVAPPRGRPTEVGQPLLPVIGDIALVAPGDPAAMRGLRDRFRDAASALASLAASARERLFWFVGERPGVGTTSVVAGLAAALAEAGRKVMVIDCNPSNPSVHLLLNVPPGPGIADIVLGRAAEPTACVQRTAGERVAVVPCGGPAAGDGHDWLNWPDLGMLVESFGVGYDLVLVDCPAATVWAAGGSAGVGRTLWVVDGSRPTEQSRWSPGQSGSLTRPSGMVINRSPA